MSLNIAAAGLFIALIAGAFTWVRAITEPDNKTEEASHGRKY